MWWWFMFGLILTGSSLVGAAAMRYQFALGPWIGIGIMLSALPFLALQRYLRGYRWQGRPLGPWLQATYSLALYAALWYAFGSILHPWLWRLGALCLLGLCGVLLMRK